MTTIKLDLSNEALEARKASVRAAEITEKVRRGMARTWDVRNQLSDLAWRLSRP